VESSEVLVRVIEARISILGDLLMIDDVAGAWKAGPNIFPSESSPKLILDCVDKLWGERIARTGTLRDNIALVQNFHFHR
jgi:hypothetical protein